MPNLHLLFLPHPYWHQKKAKLLTICLWLGKNVCSTRGNFSGPSELKILMSWENLGWGRGNKKQTQWMSATYCATGKCLQNVLIVVKEVREMLLCLCHLAFLTWEQQQNMKLLYLSMAKAAYVHNLGLREHRRDSRARRESVWVYFQLSYEQDLHSKCGWGKEPFLAEDRARKSVLPLTIRDQINQSCPLDLFPTAKSKQGTLCWRAGELLRGSD